MPEYKLKPIDVVRFWSNVQTGDVDACWEWRAGRSRDGYGCFSLKGKPLPASRVAYAIVYGPIGGAVVRHTCDNPPCCNPRHLITGTPRDNTMDRNIRGRTTKGSDVHTAKLTEADVIALRAAPRSEWPSIAKRLGRPYVTIYSAAIGRSWKHLPNAAPLTNT